MTRLARVVVEGVPHHVTQRGNRLAADVLPPGGLPDLPGLDGGGLHRARPGGMGVVPDAEPRASGRGAGQAGMAQVGEAENRLIGKPVSRLFSGTFLLVTHALETAG